MSGSIVPFFNVAPENCAKIADDGDDAISILKRWRLTVVVDSQLPTAVAQLRRIAQRATFGETDVELLQSAESIDVASDWIAICNFLTDEPVAQIAEELSQATRVGANSRKSNDIRTQFWFGTILARAGLRPTVPKVQTRRPDFVVHIDGLELAMEVKRPESLHSVMPNVKKAASQIRDFGLPGFVVLDLSQAFDTRLFSTRTFEAGPTPTEIFRPHFRQETDAIAARIDGYGANDKFARIVGSLSLAKLPSWQTRPVLAPKRQLFADATVYDRACSGLIIDTAHRVIGTIRSACSSLSYDGLTSNT